MTAPEGTAPGRAAYEAYWRYAADEFGADADDAAPPPGRWTDLPSWQQRAIAAGARAAVAAAAAAQPADLRDLAGEVIAAYEASISYDETPRDRSRVAGWRARLAAAAQPAPGDLESAYLYHCKFNGLGGDEYGLFWRKADADAAAAKRAGEGYTEVLGVAILGDGPAAPAAPAAAPGNQLLSDHLRERGRPRVAAMVEDAEQAAPDCDGLCMTAAEVGVPVAGNPVAYAHLGCPAHDPEPAFPAAQAALARVLSWFAPNGAYRKAEVTRAQLAHAYADGELEVPDELRRFL